MGLIVRNAIYWVVALAGIWALVMFLCFDFQLLTGWSIANVPKSKRPPHEIVPGVTAEELLLHVGLMALWYLTYRWWRGVQEES